jgi:hypothetical protein
MPSFHANPPHDGPCAHGASNLAAVELVGPRNRFVDAQQRHAVNLDNRRSRDRSMGRSGCSSRSVKLRRKEPRTAWQNKGHARGLSVTIAQMRSVKRT